MNTHQTSNTTTMRELLQKFENKEPEIVFEWHDSETEAVGWVVINSLRGGAAGGGTRMRVGLDKHEVKSLAKTMEVKFTVSGPAIGGAKSGINFNPHDPRKRGVLERWYKAVAPLLRSYYGTGGDLNVDEIHEVIPITESCGVWHPQEGVFTGHFQPTKPQKINRIGQLRYGVVKVLDDAIYTPDLARKYTVADMITGFGVASAVFHYYQLWQKQTDLSQKRAIIQGWGNVASAAAFYLAQKGVKIVGIIDREGGLLRPDGFSFAQIQKLFLNKKGNQLHSADMLDFETVSKKIWDIGAEIFIPAAASRLVTKAQIERMQKGGLEVISSGANVPFADPEIFMGKIAEYADQNVSVIPDFIANCGMARVFAYLMSQDKVDMSDKGIFEDTSRIIFEALEKVRALNPEKTRLTETAFEIALKVLV
jgi:glutamate dehydrogenase/leucine dehydrogenase